MNKTCIGVNTCNCLKVGEKIKTQILGVIFNKEAVLVVVYTQLRIESNRKFCSDVKLCNFGGIYIAIKIMTIHNSLKQRSFFHAAGFASDILFRKKVENRQNVFP